MSQYEYRVSIKAELFFTVKATNPLSAKALRERVDAMIGDDGYRVPELPDGTAYHCGDITPNVMVSRKDGKEIK